MDFSFRTSVQQNAGPLNVAVCRECTTKTELKTPAPILHKCFEFDEIAGYASDFLEAANRNEKDVNFN